MCQKDVPIQQDCLKNVPLKMDDKCQNNQPWFAWIAFNTLLSEHV